MTVEKNYDEARVARVESDDLGVDMFDAAGNLIYSENVYGFWERWDYDSRGCLRLHEDSDGHWVRWHYDESGAPVRWDNSAGSGGDF